MCFQAVLDRIKYYALNLVPTMSALRDYNKNEKTNDK